MSALRDLETKVERVIRDALYDIRATSDRVSHAGVVQAASAALGWPPSEVWAEVNRLAAEGDAWRAVAS